MDFTNLSVATQELSTNSGTAWVAQAWQKDFAGDGPAPVLYEAAGDTEGAALRALAVKLRKSARLRANEPVIVLGWNLDELAASK